MLYRIVKETGWTYDDIAAQPAHRINEFLEWLEVEGEVDAQNQ